MSVMVTKKKVEGHFSNSKNYHSLLWTPLKSKILACLGMVCTLQHTPHQVFKSSTTQQNKTLQILQRRRKKVKEKKKEANVNFIPLLQTLDITDLGHDNQ